jgi:hypothetical protein
LANVVMDYQVRMEGIVRKLGLFVGTLASAALVAASASAAIITNGSFETNAGNGELGYNTSATGWSVSAPPGSYVFLWNAGGGGASGTTADNGGAPGVTSPPNVQLWGPGTGSVNGLTTSPDGGAFIGEDPVYDANNPAISQTLTGLTAGDQYTVSFYWAAAQQYGFSGATTEGWTVDFGSSTDSTALYSLPNEGFSGWMKQSYTFTADGASDVLTFIADGGPSSSLPPFALLDGVSVTPGPVPEPATWALMLVGLGALGAGLRMRRGAVTATA